MPPAKSSCRRKRRRTTAGGGDNSIDLFDTLPNDVVLYILSLLCSSASSPSDFFNLLLTCRRMKALGNDPVVLSKASAECFTPSASNWCSSSQKFIKSCADAGNSEACYTLGMIRFYCMDDRGGGAGMMAKAAMMGKNPRALYSLAVILFNGSGGRKEDKDLRGGVALCARAAAGGYVDAIRELGHCLQDGYGVKKNVVEGRRILVDANARELSFVNKKTGFEIGSCSNSAANSGKNSNSAVNLRNSRLMSDYGCDVGEVERHPASRFMKEWFRGEGEGEGAERRVCSEEGCGRRESRRNEFRRCAACGGVTYCSRACQALDWKRGHKERCVAPAPAAAAACGDGREAHVVLG